MIVAVEQVAARILYRLSVRHERGIPVGGFATGVWGGQGAQMPTGFYPRE